jgi:hypothetical protein
VSCTMWVRCSWHLGMPEDLHGGLRIARPQVRQPSQFAFSQSDLQISLPRFLSSESRELIEQIMRFFPRGGTKDRSYQFLLSWTELFIHQYPAVVITNFQFSCPSLCQSFPNYKQDISISGCEWKFLALQLFQSWKGIHVVWLWDICPTLPKKTTRTAQYLTSGLSAWFPYIWTCWVTHVAADARISCLFALVKDASIAVKVRVKLSSTAMTGPIDAAICDLWFRNKRMQTGTMRSTIMADIFREDAIMFKPRREYSMIDEVSGLVFSDNSYSYIITRLLCRQIWVYSPMGRKASMPSC